jgi:hypothetical protein
MAGPVPAFPPSVADGSRGLPPPSLVTQEVGIQRPLPYAPGWHPAPPPPRREWHGLRVAIVVVVVVTVLLIAGIAVLGVLSSQQRFTCPGVAWTIDYAWSPSGYFGSYPQTGCLGYPVSGPTGYEIAVLLSLTNMALTGSHRVTAITVASPTEMNSVSPPLPVTLAPGGTANLTLNVTILTLTGDYVVAGSITTD